MQEERENDLSGNAKASQSSGSNRRIHERHHLTRFVWFQTIPGDGVEPADGISYCVDVSRGGLGLVVKTAVPCGTLLFVEVVFDGLHHRIAAVCRVVHTAETENGSSRLGLEFVVVPPEARQFLSEHFE